MRGLWRLTWIELKIFVREPLGLIGTIAMPVVSFLVVGRLIGGRSRGASPRMESLMAVDLPVFAAILISLSAVLSLITIVAIYREGGILKRLRATPLAPVTILGAHVLVKLLLTAATLALLVLAGKRYYPAELHPPLLGGTAALLFSTASILSIGFVIASVVPTARFAQPVGTLILYPMIAISGLFIPIEALPPALRVLARLCPLTYAVSLLRGVLRGDSWAAHVPDALALVVVFAVSMALATRVFRWE
jgi:ABC-2 type transport system permease protein